MKHILNFVACFLLAAVTAWGGGLPEAAGPFITKDTAAVVKLDLKNWNVDNLVADAFQQLEQQAPALLQQGNPAAESVAQIQAVAEEVSKNAQALVELGVDSVILVAEIRVEDGEENPVLSVVFPCKKPSKEVVKSIDELADALPEADDMRENRAVVATKQAVAWIYADKTDTDGIFETFQSADRPDLEAGLARVEECRLCAVVTPKTLPPIPEDEDMPTEVRDAIQTCESLAVGLDVQGTILECNLISYATFENEAAAERALTLKDTLLAAMSEGVPDEEFRPMFEDFMALYLEILEYKRDGNVLSMNVQENCAAWVTKNLGWFKDYQAYCTKNKAERADFDTAAEADRLAKCIAPFTTAQTLFVAHFDLERFNLGDMSEVTLNQLEKLFPRTFSSDSPLVEGVQIWEAFVEGFETKRAQFLAAGAKDMFVLVNIHGPGSVPFLCVIPVDTDNPKRLAKLQNLAPLAGFLPEREQEDFLSGLWAGYYEGNVVFMSNPGVLGAGPESAAEAAEFVQVYCEELQAAVVERPQFRDGFALGAAECFQLVFAMNPAVREGIAAGLENLEEGLTRPSNRLVARGLDVVTLAADPHTGVLSLQAYSKSDAAAQNLVTLFDTWKSEALAMARVASEDDPTVPIDNLEQAHNMFRLIQEGRRVTLHVELPVGPDGAVTQGQTFVTGAAIMGMGVGLLLPAVQQTRSAARIMQNNNNFKMIALCMLNYESAMKHFPPAYTVDADGKPLHSWRVLILPYIEQYALYKQIRLDEPWDSEWNSQFHEISIPEYQDPRMNFEPGQTTYSVVVGEETVFDPKGKKGCSIGQIRDGTSNTILVTEKKEPFCWMDPTADIRLEEIGESAEDSPILSFQGYWTCAMCDGSVQMLPMDIPGKILKYLFLRNDRTPTSPRDYTE